MQQMEQATQSQAQQMLMSDPTSNALLQTQMAETKRKGEEAQARFTLEREKLQAEMADKVRDMQAKLAEIQSKMGLEQSLSDQDNAAKIARGTLDLHDLRRFNSIRLTANTTAL